VITQSSATSGDAVKRQWLAVLPIRTRSFWCIEPADGAAENGDTNRVPVLVANPAADVS
jgi:hypothetical protein